MISLLIVVRPHFIKTDRHILPIDIKRDALLVHARKCARVTTSPVSGHVQFHPHARAPKSFEVRRLAQDSIEPGR
jgi:hypothetical protein